GQPASAQRPLRDTAAMPLRALDPPCSSTPSRLAISRSEGAERRSRPRARADPVRARSRHDPQTAVAPELPLRSEPMRRHDDRNQSGASDRPEAGRGLQERNDRVLPGLSEKIALRLLLLLDQKVEVLVESRRSRLGDGSQQ